MIVYLDTSALVPLLISEPATATCAELWDGADRITSTRLSYLEAVAALAMAQALGRISQATLAASRALLDDLWPAIDVIELTEALMLSAADLALTHSLRGDDSTHCAAALSVRQEDLVAASGDRKLIAAWQREGLSVCDTRQVRTVGERLV